MMDATPVNSGVMQVGMKGALLPYLINVAAIKLAAIVLM